MSTREDRTLPEHIDVVVIGAGLSGVGAGYRLQTECPDRDYVILEMREAMGGTWDLFRYPGVRSDSDMFTLGYEFKPWRDEKSIADAETILSYIHETADEFGIEERIRYGVKVLTADFDTEAATWRLTLDVRGECRELACDFLYCCAGYYDYDHGHQPEFPGVDSFAGDVVYPQFWPEHLDYAGKRVVVVGSGATAVTIVPAMAERAAHVTMLQRSPTWIGSVPGRDKIADRIRAVLPAKVAHRVVRTKNILFQQAFFQFCQRYPDRARKLILGATAKSLGTDVAKKHFSPSYRPWDQRFCAIPDADLFKTIRAGKAEVVTDTIERFEPEGIRLSSGELLEADVVVSATGLKLLACGGIEPSVDGETVDLADQFVWQGAMITGIPNFAICIGYTNASWTLRADLSHRLICKVLNHMSAAGQDVVVPEPEGELEERPLLDLQSGYVQRAISAFPRQGDHGPWRVRQNYLLDSATTMRRDLTQTLRFGRRADTRASERLERSA